MLKTQITSPRLQDIADRVGVSRNTVARVLLGTGGKNTRVSVETANRIARVARSMNYQPNRVAQQLAGRASKTFGVIADSRAVEIQHALLGQIEQAAHRYGYGVMVSQSNGEMNRVARYLDDFTARRIDGVICFSHTYPEHGDELEQMFAGRGPCVFVHRPIGKMKRSASFVDVDRADGIAQAVRHLVAKDRKRIAFLLGKKRESTMQERLLGYQQGHRELGIEMDPDLVTFADLDEMRDDLADLIDPLVDRGAEAILASNDIVAMRVIRHLMVQRKLRVPDDVAVVGFDNIMASQYCVPSLTTVDFSLRSWAVMTVEMLIEQIEAKGAAVQPRQVMFKPQLIVRESA